MDNGYKFNKSEHIKSIKEKLEKRGTGPIQNELSDITGYTQGAVSRILNSDRNIFVKRDAGKTEVYEVTLLKQF